MFQTRWHAVLVGLVGCTLGGMAWAAGLTADPPPPPATRADIHPLLWQRIADEGEPVKAWVFFRDKGLRDAGELAAALHRLAESYDRHAIQRRRLRGTPEMRAGQVFDVIDVPVAAAYVDAVAATGARVHVTSRWLNAVSVYASGAQLRRIAALPFVDRLEPVGRSRGLRPVELEPPDKPLEEPAAPLGAGLNYGVAAAQLNQIQVIALHNAGYTGAGVRVGVLDTGFSRIHQAFNHPAKPLQVIAEWDFINNDPNTGIQPGDPPGQHTHGTLILGCLAAYQPGTIVGGAFDAAFILCKTEDTAGEYPAEEDNYVAGLEFVEFHGGDMVTASLGYIDWYTQAQLDGRTAVTTIGVNVATSRGIHCCNAAGNEGHDSNPAVSHLIAPADAFQVIACGAVSSTGAIASFSSDGPTADGRVKPEVLARGVSTYTVSTSGTTGTTTASGTSLSTPLVACAVACLTQARPAWTVDQLRNALFLTADYYLANRAFDPLYIRGYGVINALAPLQDCNNNGVPDLTDIAHGTSRDCQRNGVPDECDIAGGASQDCNGNAVPDECDITPPPPVLVSNAPPVLGWREISGTGTPLNLSDDGAVNVTMPFTNSVFTSNNVRVGNNGAIGFNTTASLSYLNTTMPTASLFNGAQALAIYWDDLDSDTGNVYHQTIGTTPNRTFIVEWYERPHYPGDAILDGDEVTLQIQIFETPVNGIFAQYLYLDTDFLDPALNHGASATVGFQKNATEGHQWSYNQPNAVNPGVILSLRSQGAPYSQDQNQNGIPDECEGLKGDLNCDGAANTFDIDPFVLALTNPAAYAAAWPNCNILNADCNRDGRINAFDIDPFVRLIVP